MIEQSGWQLPAMMFVALVLSGEAPEAHAEGVSIDTVGQVFGAPEGGGSFIGLLIERQSGKREVR